MMARLIGAAKNTPDMPAFTVEKMAVNCHHNYVNVETHFGKTVYLTRKGAVRDYFQFSLNVLIRFIAILY